MQDSKAVELLIETIRNYLRARGRMIYSLMDAAGQDKVSIELHALYWYYPGNSI